MQTIKGRTKQPPRIIVSGEHGIGKSTFASQFPKPIALDTEGGLEMVGVERTPKLETYLQFQEALAWVGTQDFKTLIIDSIDWLETLIQQDIAARAGVKEISEIPYGQGYKRVSGELSTLLAELDRLNREKRMTIVMVAHVKVSTFKDPLGADYDKYSLDLRDDFSRLLRDWCDVVMFAQVEKFVKVEDKGFSSSAKAKATGRRVACLSQAPGYDAKNRYGLPAVMDFDFQQIWSAILASMATPTASKSTEPETKLELVEEVNV